MSDSGHTDLRAVLESVAERGRALVSARVLVIERRLDGEMLIAAGAGELPAGLIGQCVDARDSVASASLRLSSTLRLEDEPNRARFERHDLGRLGFHADAGLVIPLISHNQGVGVLIAVDRLEFGPVFSDDDRHRLEAFAAAAAIAIAAARPAETKATTRRLAGAERERGRWARALQHETFRNLAALQLDLADQLRSDDPETLETSVRDAVERLDFELADLRALIAELRSPALDHAGIGSAIEDLAEHTRRQGLEVLLSLDIGTGAEPERYSAELETAVYRIAQEALSNAMTHGRARRALIEIDGEDHVVSLTVSDDGHGFDPQDERDGFGLHSMRERAQAVGGTLKVNSAPGQGTVITATLPAPSGATVRRLWVSGGRGSAGSAGADDGAPRPDAEPYDAPARARGRDLHSAPPRGTPGS